MLRAQSGPRNQQLKTANGTKKKQRSLIKQNNPESCRQETLAIQKERAKLQRQNEREDKQEVQSKTEDIRKKRAQKEKGAMP